MVDKVKELRTIVPVPMGEAIQLLKTNNGDVEKCIYIFKAKSIEEICKLTGCDEKMAAECYEAEKFDFNRTVSSIKDAIYDQNYKPIEGVTREAVSNILQWMRVIETEDFGVSLDYQLLDKALDTMSLISTLKETADMVTKAKAAKNTIFAGYSDTDSLDEFVRRHRQLDDNEDFQTANKLVPLRLTVLKEEILRHARNL